MPKPNYYFYLFILQYKRSSVCVWPWLWESECNFIGRDKVSCGPQYTTPSYRGPTKQAWPFFVFASAVKKESYSGPAWPLCCACPLCIFCSVFEILGTFGYSKNHWLYITYGIPRYMIMIYGLFCYKFFCFSFFVCFSFSIFRFFDQIMPQD